MSLISHRRSAYVDDDELERAAGMFEIEAEQAEGVQRGYYEGAACALRLLNAHDFRSCADLMVAFHRSAFDMTS